MMMPPGAADTEDEELVRRAATGDGEALDRLFRRHTPRLRRMVRLRLDWRLSGRVDEDDVLQEVALDAARRLPEFLRDRKLPFFLWLRLLTAQKIVDLHRHHLGVKARDVRRQVSLSRRPFPEASSEILAAHLVGDDTTPSQSLARTELRARIQEALDDMEPNDREVLVLKHYENLTSREIAHELGIQEAAAGKRYIRALARIRRILDASSGDPRV